MVLSSTLYLILNIGTYWFNIFLLCCVACRFFLGKYGLFLGNLFGWVLGHVLVALDRVHSALRYIEGRLDRLTILNRFLNLGSALRRLARHFTAFFPSVLLCRLQCILQQFSYTSFWGVFFVDDIALLIGGERLNIPTLRLRCHCWFLFRQFDLRQTTFSNFRSLRRTFRQ